MYPTRFESAKGKQGYGPACANKFVKGLCELPKVKCGECKNQKFFPADDAAYRSHLLGDHVMGVYPMLPDSTCWFLAVDFDKATWTDDVRAFIATCRKLDLPFVVERSREDAARDLVRRGSRTPRRASARLCARRHHDPAYTRRRVRPRR